MKKNKKITIVMATYKRNDFISDRSHPTISLVKNDLIDKIIIVWQNVGEKVPKSIIENLDYHCKGKYHFEYPKVNSMNNRFIKYDSIETDYVMVVDDDYNATKKSIIAMHEQLMKNEDALVGCVPRKIKLENNNFVYEFSPEKNKTSFNFILLGYSMFHKKFLDFYQKDKAAIKLVDELFNADDIYFNYMHEKYTNAKIPKILVSDLKVNTWRIVKGNSISDDNDHLNKRKKMCQFLENKGYANPRDVDERIDLNHLNIDINHAYWINLDKSKQRKAEFEKDVLNILSDDNLQFLRFPGLDLTSESYVGRRAAGCSFSHLSCWRDAYRRNIKYIIMFEDDFQLTVSKEKFNQTIKDLIKNHPDFLICNIGYNRIENENDRSLESGFYKYNDIQTTSAYIARVDFLMHMYPHVMDAAMSLIVGGGTREFAIDRIWKIFQKDDRWLCSERLGIQRSSYSEIERKKVDYKT